MMPRKISVLLDMSMACRGYCGIAQDVRLLYKTLSRRPEIEVTGLVYRPQKFSRPHRFLPPSAPRAERIANQSQFLWKLAEPRVQWSSFRGLRILEQARSVSETLIAGRARIETLETKKFWPILWRLLFSQTLESQDQPLVQQGKFLLADTTDGKVFARSFSRRRPIQLDTRGYDFLIVQGPRAFRTSTGTKLIVRYHDMIPVLEPDTMGNPLVISWHERALRENREGHFVCNSEPTREDLIQMHPELAERSNTIPYMLSQAYHSESASVTLKSIMESRRSPACGPGRPLRRAPKYILTVSTIEPRKNYLALLRAFGQLRMLANAENVRLVIVGSPGWKFEPIFDTMRPLIASGDVIHLQSVAPHEMRVLYSHAEAFVFPSTAEGFGFPPLEAMSCGVPVVASDLPAHRWVLGDAALYCNPLQASSISGALKQVLFAEDAGALRRVLTRRGLQRAAEYSLENCGRQWVDLFNRLRGADAASEGKLARPAVQQRLRIAS